ncbi:MAG: hypothetical protein HZC12_03775 [Nitrospirae bacterium]|nr:hypothetical protein [Nitrospirota bacterium]
MEEKRKESLIAVLRESPFYSILPVEAKCFLIKSLIRNHPSLFIEGEQDIDMVVGYEGSWPARQPE